MAFRSKLARYRNKCCEQVMPVPLVPKCVRQIPKPIHELPPFLFCPPIPDPSHHTNPSYTQCYMQPPPEYQSPYYHDSEYQTYDSPQLLLPYNPSESPLLLQYHEPSPTYEPSPTHEPSPKQITSPSQYQQHYRSLKKKYESITSPSSIDSPKDQTPLPLSPLHLELPLNISDISYTCWPYQLEDESDDIPVIAFRPISEPLRSTLQDRIKIQHYSSFEVPSSGTIVTNEPGITPEGYLPCDGRTLSQTMYPTLFLEIGMEYGEGEDSNTFTIPNLEDLNGSGIFYIIKI